MTCELWRVKNACSILHTHLLLEADVWHQALRRDDLDVEVERGEDVQELVHGRRPLDAGVGKDSYNLYREGYRGDEQTERKKVR